jgi:hypothetical protein
MLQLNKVRGDRFSCCLGFERVDFEEDGAIAPLAFPDIQVSVERLLA